MNAPRVLCAVLLVLYLLLLLPFTDYMRHKPIVEKLGYTPQVEVLRLVSADQKQFVAASLIMKVLFYFGSLTEKNSKEIVIPPDYFGMYRTVESAVRLDPYNLDGYYFAQAVLVWDVKRIREANSLLEYGMKYRDWDYMLPFFAGFNNAYFLKDYAAAARYYKRAGDLSGAELYVNLAGRYLYESGQTALAVNYLKAMVKGAKNDAIRESFRKRLAALEGVQTIEEAVMRYRRENGTRPDSIELLMKKGYLDAMPADPYGGRYYIDTDGQVRSTSKFASVPAKR